MKVYDILLVLSGACAIWAVVSWARISAYLEQRGVATPFLLARAYALRNISEYRRITRSETGRAGPLFYSFVFAINGVWIFGLAAAMRTWG